MFGSSAEDRSQLIQGLIGVLVVLGLFGYIGAALFLGKSADPPEIVKWTVVGVVSYIFGQRAVTSGVHAATNGIAAVAAAQVTPAPALAPGESVTRSRAPEGNGEPPAPGTGVAP